MRHDPAPVLTAREALILAITLAIGAGVIGAAIERVTGDGHGMTVGEYESLACAPIHNAMPAPARKEIDL